MFILEQCLISYNDLHTLRGCLGEMSIWMYVYPTYLNNFDMQDC